MLTLYGSTTSPYVRRTRIWLASTGIDHQFTNLQIFDENDRTRMVAKNPTMKIPMLEDDGEVIFDSRVIYRYLNDKFAYPSLSWEKENQLTLIDAANDSFVELLLLQRSGLDTSEDKMFFNLQRQRVKTTLTHLDALAGKGYFKDWNYPSICLYCLVDWVAFRELHDLSSLVNLLDIVSTNSNRPEVVNTDPR